MNKLSIIMPAFNEGETIRNSIILTHHEVKEITDDFEIIVVDDGSKDKTFQEALKTSSQFHRVTCIKLDRNLGKCSALKEGFAKSNGDMVVFLDADLDISPDQISNFIRLLKTKNCDGVIGSKLHPYSRVNYPFYRKIISLTYYGIIKVLFGLPIRDTQTGIKAFHRDVLKYCFNQVSSKSFAYDLELLVRAHRRGYVIMELPVTVNHFRRFGYIPLSTFWHVIRDTWTIFWKKI